MGNEQEAMETVRRAGRAFNERDRESFDAAYAASLKVLTGNGPDDYVEVDHDAHWDAVQPLFDLLDVRVSVEEMFADGDRVFVRWTYSCRHVGEIRGIPPTGKAFDVETWEVMRVQDGVITEERALQDQLTLFLEVGAVELPEPTPAD